MEKRLNWLRPRFSPRRLLGARGEKVAGRYLRRLGYRILLRNYRCPAGEIDLICQDGDTIVFVEVRTRSLEEQPKPDQVAGPRKWVQVERVARYFLMQRGIAHRPARFDLVTVAWPARGAPHVEHFISAHEPRTP